MRRRSVIYHHQQGCEDKLAQHLQNLFIFVSSMGFGVAKFSRIEEARILSSGPAKSK